MCANPISRSTAGGNPESLTVRGVLCAYVLLGPSAAWPQARVATNLTLTTAVGIARWQQPQWMIAAGLAVIATLAVLITYLLHKQTQLTRARREQTRLSGMLINAGEEERKRLASELHDDFSQRLALLSLGLENVAELLPPGCARANEQLHELVNSASELGADMHTLSHRLHSSTLEKLGLVPGVASFCREFAAQKHIQVAFTHRDVPRSVSPGVALCLFRVVQEALRNVKKHSGASEATVRLNRVNGYLHLAISDNGAGFDSSDRDGGKGIGLLSMQERARLIGAQLAIWSEPRKGTRIDLWAPYRPPMDPDARFPVEEAESAIAVEESRR